MRGQEEKESKLSRICGLRLCEAGVRFRVVGQQQGSCCAPELEVCMRRAQCVCQTHKQRCEQVLISESCFLCRGLAGKVRVGVVVVLLPLKARSSGGKEKVKGSFCSATSGARQHLEDQS